VGSIKGVFAKYSHLSSVLPAMGYGSTQIDELQQTINAADCDLVLIGTPIDLTQILKVNRPAARVLYELEEIEPGRLQQRVEKAL